MKITTAESNPDMELLTQQTFSFSPDDLAWAKKMKVITISIVSGRAKFAYN